MGRTTLPTTGNMRALPAAAWGETLVMMLCLGCILSVAAKPADGSVAATAKNSQVSGSSSANATEVSSPPAVDTLTTDAPPMSSTTTSTSTSTSAPKSRRKRSPWAQYLGNYYYSLPYSGLSIGGMMYTGSMSPYMG